jgi:hypothetical protein
LVILNFIKIFNLINAISLHINKAHVDAGRRKEATGGAWKSMGAIGDSSYS